MTQMLVTMFLVFPLIFLFIRGKMLMKKRPYIGKIFVVVSSTGIFGILVHVLIMLIGVALAVALALLAAYLLFKAINKMYKLFKK